MVRGLPPFEPQRPVPRGRDWRPPVQRRQLVLLERLRLLTYGDYDENTAGEVMISADCLSRRYTHAPWFCLTLELISGAQKTGVATPANLCFPNRIVMTMSLACIKSMNLRIVKSVSINRPLHEWLLSYLYLITAIDFDYTPKFCIEYGRSDLPLC